MTIVVAIRTGAAVVIAADSKVTTVAPSGKNADGSIHWLPQTYDHAVKISQDATGTAIAAFSGNGNIGEQGCADYFSRVSAHLHVSVDAQDRRIAELAAEMTATRVAFARKIGVPAKQIPSTVALVAGPPEKGIAPRVWRVELEGESPRTDEILQNGGVWFEGSTDMMMSLMYGALPAYESGIRTARGIDPVAFDTAKKAALDQCPIRQVNFLAMPVQDALDFAAFAATVQVEMDRFRPGLAPTGGPIDLAVLEMAPQPRIRSFPGKTLRHPTLP